MSSGAACGSDDDGLSGCWSAGGGDGCDASPRRAPGVKKKATPLLPAPRSSPMVNVVASPAMRLASPMRMPLSIGSPCRDAASGVGRTRLVLLSKHPQAHLGVGCDIAGDGRVVSVAHDSPADAAGVRVNHRVLSVCFNQYLPLSYDLDARREAFARGLAAAPTEFPLVIECPPSDMRLFQRSGPLGAGGGSDAGGVTAAAAAGQWLPRAGSDACATHRLVVSAFFHMYDHARYPGVGAFMEEWEVGSRDAADQPMLGGSPQATATNGGVGASRNVRLAFARLIDGLCEEHGLGKAEAHDWRLGASGMCVTHFVLSQFLEVNEAALLAGERDVGSLLEWGFAELERLTGRVDDDDDRPTNPHATTPLEARRAILLHYARLARVPFGPWYSEVPHALYPQLFSLSAEVMAAVAALAAVAVSVPRKAGPLLATTRFGLSEPPATTEACSDFVRDRGGGGGGGDLVNPGHPPTSPNAGTLDDDGACGVGTTGAVVTAHGICLEGDPICGPDDATTTDAFSMSRTSTVGDCASAAAAGRLEARRFAGGSAWGRTTNATSQVAASMVDSTAAETNVTAAQGSRSVGDETQAQPAARPSPHPAPSAGGALAMLSPASVGATRGGGGSTPMLPASRKGALLASPKPTLSAGPSPALRAGAGGVPTGTAHTGTCGGAGSASKAAPPPFSLIELEGQDPAAAAHAQCAGNFSIPSAVRPRAGTRDSTAPGGDGERLTASRLGSGGDGGFGGGVFQGAALGNTQQRSALCAQRYAGSECSSNTSNVNSLVGSDAVEHSRDAHIEEVIQRWGAGDRTTQHDLQHRLQQQVEVLDTMADGAADASVIAAQRRAVEHTELRLAVAALRDRLGTAEHDARQLKMANNRLQDRLVHTQSQVDRYVKDTVDAKAAAAPAATSSVVEALRDELVQQTRKALALEAENYSLTSALGAAGAGADGGVSTACEERVGSAVGNRRRSSHDSAGGGREGGGACAAGGVDTSHVDPHAGSPRVSKDQRNRVGGAGDARTPKSPPKACSGGADTAAEPDNKSKSSGNGDHPPDAPATDDPAVLRASLELAKDEAQRFSAQLVELKTRHTWALTVLDRLGLTPEFKSLAALETFPAVLVQSARRRTNATEAVAELQRQTTSYV